MNLASFSGPVAGTCQALGRPLQLLCNSIKRRPMYCLALNERPLAAFQCIIRAEFMHQFRYGGVVVFITVSPDNFQNYGFTV